MKFRLREGTETLIIKRVDTGGKSVRELEREEYLKGKFGVDFHYLVSSDGYVEPGRESAVVAGYPLDPTRKAIVVIVEAESKMRLTDAQEVALESLIDSLLATYPTLEIERR